jgi:hypothetical protein
MKFGAIIGGVVGLCLSAWLLESYGVGRILGLLHHAGWFGILTVIAFHLSKPLEFCAQMNPKKACAAWTSDDPFVGQAAKVCLAQILFSALGWCVIAGPTVPRPGLRTYMVMRWMREAVNNLLPVGQIGGEFVAARLLQRSGMKLAPAIAGTVAEARPVTAPALPMQGGIL